YFTDYLGLDVADITDLRKKLLDGGVEYRVVKNTLVKLATQNAGIDGLNDVFEGSTAIAFSYDDATAPAKVLHEFTQTHDLPQLKAFIFEGEVMDKSVFTKIATLPSKETLLTKLVGGLSSPMSKMSSMLKSPMINIVNVLNSLKETKES
ncbi:MAG: 50S ribosomal protein L10, partial [Candidatus Marinimicrobia bacterium]|nr:50S ribosomal protein L10 [Candidatus Neomarinimicrobiota bacterium]